MDMREHWDRLADVWEQRTVAQHEQLDPAAIVALDAIPLDAGHAILDIGCGPGVTTIELVQRAGPGATVTGIDVSEGMIHHAEQRRRRAVSQDQIRPGSVTLRVADAQRDALGTGYDVAFSNCGVMFFDDPHAAFANLASTLKPDGWLSIVTWATAQDNPWMPLATAAAAPVLGVNIDPPSASGPGPFSLADQADTTALLTNAGFDRLDVIDVTQPRRVAHGSERHWADLAIRTGGAADAYTAADHDLRAAAIDAAINAMAPHRQSGPTGDWLLPAHARVYLARRA